MISFAQNAEDVVLGRCFRDQDSGRYIDIGAAHPTDHSVTRHFYEAGWRGINVEPHPEFLRLLQEARPEDVNLGCAVGHPSGRSTFFLGPFEHPGGSTLCREVAAQAWTDPLARTIDVQVISLDELFDRYVGDGTTIDFLKVDVEGSEREVIAGCAWQRWRPRVLIVEATVPNTEVQCHGEWEPILLRSGYDLALFDGLNRFYVRHEDPALVDRLAAPANVFDNWVPARLAQLERELAAAEEELARLRRVSR
jgi:FkbM family methyltransferase